MHVRVLLSRYRGRHFTGADLQQIAVELDADLERGAIEPAEADYARAEIGRRLLAAQEAALQRLASASDSAGTSGAAASCAALKGLRSTGPSAAAAT